MSNHPCHLSPTSSLRFGAHKFSCSDLGRLTLIPSIQSSGMHLSHIIDELLQNLPDHAGISCHSATGSFAGVDSKQELKGGRAWIDHCLDCVACGRVS